MYRAISDSFVGMGVSIKPYRPRREVASAQHQPPQGRRERLLGQHETHGTLS